MGFNTLCYLLQLQFYINIFVRMNPEKKLKLILASLKDRQIIKFFEVFSSNFPDQFKKTIRQISFNCFESACEFKNKSVSGYGKNSQESFVNSVRTLVQLLADDTKLHPIMRQSLRIAQQLVSANCESQKKLTTIDKDSLNCLKNIAVNCNTKQPVEKKTTLKQEIFEYLNLDNLKISNPNSTHKTKHHEKYLSQSNNQQEDLSVEEVLKRNRQLEEKITKAKQENIRLKYQLKLSQKDHEKGQQTQNLKYQAANTGVNIKPRDSYEPLKTRTNDYLNMSQDTKVLEKSKLRSVSVQASQTQKYIMPKSGNEKKIAVPKLNLQILPNYHGKSNKSLNQSLMEVYEKTHAK